MLMDCPKSIKLKHTLLTSDKCNKNIHFWKSRYSDVEENASFIANGQLSEAVLPCHTFAYEALKQIFGYDESTKKFNKKQASLLSAKEKLLASGKKDYDPIPAHMSESIENGHDVFAFAYHGVHNPYHRKHDSPPIRPFGAFLKRDIEIFSCVHGSPWDITVKNPMAEPDVNNGNIDKYYLFPEDLRKLKPIQIQKIPALRNDFWYYFGDPSYWQKIKGYGNKLYETAGEMRYYEKIIPDQFAGLLWPMWYPGTDTTVEDNNINLQIDFKIEYPEIPIINYALDKFENFVLSLVEASYYTQKYYVEKRYFPINAELAKIKIKS
jgi:hypothetical protein